MSIEEKISLLKYAKRELRVLLIEDKYLEIDFIADELGVNKKDVLELIKSIVSEKGKQRREFEWINTLQNMELFCWLCIHTIFIF